MQIWRLIAHHKKKKRGRAISAYREQGWIAIGWTKTGDLRRFHPKKAAAIAKRIRKNYSKAHNGYRGDASLWKFYRKVDVGDLVIVGDGQRRRLVMRVEGDYQWDDAPSGLLGYCHWRRASPLDEEDPDELWQRCGGKAARENIHWALVRCRRRLNTYP